MQGFYNGTRPLLLKTSESTDHPLEVTAYLYDETIYIYEGSQTEF